MKKWSAFAFLGIVLLVSGFSGQDVFQVIREGDAEKLKVLLEKEPSLANTPHPFGFYPIHLAAMSGRRELIEMLIEKGADVRVSFREGTVLHAAVYSGSRDVLELLISKGANVDAESESSGPPLLLAARLGRSEIAEALLARGASMNVQDRVGNTALLLAASYGHRPIVELLLEKNGNFNTANSRGATPLSVAEREGHDEIVRMLLAKGAKRGTSGLSDLRGEYFGQKRPGAKPELFAPSIVSTERNQLNAVFAPDGKEFYFAERSSSPGGNFSIMVMKDQDGRWIGPRIASFSGTYSDVDMFISRNGQELFFCSNRPLPGEKEPKKDTDIWVVRRKGSDWEERRPLGAPVNSDRNDFYPTLTDLGTLYFSSHREGSKGENDIFRAEPADGGYGAPANLGDAVNTEHREFDPFIAPDESFLIFASGRPGGLGESDLYISFRRADGSWSRAQNMGQTVNSSASDYTPMLSPDGKYLFFTSGRAGVDDIYWVDAGIIKQLKASDGPKSSEPTRARLLDRMRQLALAPALTVELIEDTLEVAFVKDEAASHDMVAFFAGAPRAGSPFEGFIKRVDCRVPTPQNTALAEPFVVVELEEAKEGQATGAGPRTTRLVTADVVAQFGQPDTFQPALPEDPESSGSYIYKVGSRSLRLSLARQAPDEVLRISIHPLEDVR